MRNTYLYSAVLTSLFATTAWAAEIDETRTMAANGTVDLEFINAEVHIKGSNSNDFHIEGELREDDYELVDTNGNIHFVESKAWLPNRNDNWLWWNDDDCDRSQRTERQRERQAERRAARGDSSNECRGYTRVEITLPVGATLRLDNTNGSLWIDNMSGNVNVNTVNGDITLSKLSNSTRAETTNGTIEANGLSGRITLETVNGEILDSNSTTERASYSTVNGDIESDAESEDLMIESVNGDITITTATLHDLEASTVGGRIDIDSALGDDARLDLSSVNGRISLTVPATTSATFDINTEVNGRISNELSGDEPERRSRYVNSSDLNFTLNGGEADVEISTVSGNVTLRPSR